MHLYPERGGWARSFTASGRGQTSRSSIRGRWGGGSPALSGRGQVRKRPPAGQIGGKVHALGGWSGGGEGAGTFTSVGTGHVCAPLLEGRRGGSRVVYSVR